MVQRVKKHFFRILPVSVAVLLVLALAIGVLSNLPSEQAKAAALSITINSVTLTLQTDADLNGITNIGDTIRVDLDVSNTDGACNVGAGTTATANLTKYGGGAAVALSCVTPNGGVNDIMRVDFPVVDAAGSGIDVGAANAGSQVNVVTADVDDAPGPNSNSNSMASAVDTIAPILATSGLTISTDNGVALVAAVNGGVVAADAVNVNATVSVADGDTITWNAAAIGGGATQANNTPATVAAGAIDNVAYAFNVTATDNAGNAVTAATSAIDATTISVDNTLPTLGTNVASISTDNGVPAVAAVNGGVVAADAVNVNASAGAADGDTITWNAAALGGGASATQANNTPVTVAAGALDGATTFNTTITDNAGNVITGASNAISVDNTLPTLGTNVASISTDNGVPAVAAVNGGVVAADAVNVNASAGAADGDTITWNAAALGGGASATQANNTPVTVAAGALDGATTFNTTITDNAGNVITGASNAISVDNTLPTLGTNVASISTDNGVPAVAAVNGGVVAADAVNVNASAGAADGDTITWNAAALGGGASATQANNTPVTVAAGALDGATTFNTTITDNAGNVITGASNAISVDNTLPTLGTNVASISTDNGIPAVAAVNGGVVVADAVNVNASAGAADGDTITWNAAALGGGASATQANNTPVTVAAGALDGATTFNTTITDNAGNVITGASNAISVDNTLPTLGTNVASISTDNGIPAVAAVNGGVVAADAVNVNASAGAADGDTITWNAAALGGGASATQANNTPVTVAAGALDGATTFNTTITDNAGNVITGASNAISVDNTLPTLGTNVASISTDNGVPAVAAVNGGVVAADAVNVNASAGAADGDTITWNAAAVGGGATQANNTPATVTAGAVDNAAYTFNTTITDNAGNVIVGASNAISVDNTLPTLGTNVASISTDNGVPAVAAVNGGIVAADAVNVNASAGAADGDTITWNAAAVGGGATQANNTPATVTAGAVDNAAYTFNTTITDNAGNAVVGASNAISVDNTLPTLATSGLTISTDNGIGGVAAVNGGAVAADAVNVNATVGAADGDTITWDASTLGGGASATQANNTPVTVAAGAVDNAAYAFNVTATDNAGNAVTAATSAIDATTISIDNIIPIVTVAGTIALTNDIGGDGIASIGDTITYAAGTETTGDGVAWAADLLAYGLSATAAPGAYVVIADDDDGAFSANETVTDNGGNTQAGAPTAITITGAFNIDNVAPNVTVAGTIALTNDIGGDGIASIGDTITYAAGTETTGDGVAWAADLLAYGLSATAAPGAYVVIADDDDGAFSANETVTDNGGNTQAGAPTAITITGAFNIDNVAPNVTVAGTIALTNDIGGDGIASIGDTITYAAGTETTGDGVAWAADLLAYGLSATATPGAYLVIADNDNNVPFAANETVTDNGGNVQAGAPTAVTAAFNIDNEAPTILTASPANGAVNVAISANVVVTFSEPMNTGTVTKTSAPNPGGWVPVWSGGNAIATYSHTVFFNNNVYTQNITAGQDLAGNALVAGVASNPWSFTTISAGSGSSVGSSSPVDQTPPGNTSIVIANGDAQTSSQTVNLTLGATDVSDMMISNSADFTGAAWESYSSAKTWALTDGYGLKTVYAKFKDSVGNASSSVSDTISYVETVTMPSETPAGTLPGQVSSTDPKTGLAISYYDPTDRAALLLAKGIMENKSCEDTYRPLLAADAKAFGVVISASQLEEAVTFVCYGITTATDNLGAGERRAMVRDYWQTTGYADVSWDDVARNAVGQKYVHRNLVLEQAQVSTALRIFRKIFGHDPNFKVVKEDMTWNTILYRLRFVRDLTLEKAGIVKFRSLFGHTPSTPLDWAVVRALGYIQ